MLFQLRDYLLREKIASNQQLAREFNLEVNAITPMLDIWIRKGLIRRCAAPAACQSACVKCQSSAPVYYQLSCLNPRK